MAKKILFLVFQLGCISLYAQFGPQQIISTEADNAYRVIPSDVDQDGFIDVMVLLRNPYKIVWYRNMDGQGTFSDEILINDDSALYLSFELVDLDFDGDKDILYVLNNPRKIGWLENLDGFGQFGSEQLLLESSEEFISAFGTADVDGDDDLDLLVTYGSSFFSRLVWMERLEGSANFGEEIELMQEVTSIYPPLAFDVDTDGDLDLITAYEIFFGPAKIVWLENQSNGTFEVEHEIHEYVFLSDWTSVYYLDYADINSDGINDLAVTSHNDDIGTYYNWLEHKDGAGNFDDLNNLRSPGVNFTNYQFQDFDNDGDNDILSSRHLGANRIFWVENTDGEGTFSIDRTISTEVDFTTSTRAVDINGDGLLDVISSSSGDNKVAWYENTGILGIQGKEKPKFNVYPVPAKDELHLSSASEINRIELFSNLGLKLKTFNNQKTISLEGLTSGFYLLKISWKDGTFSTQKLIKE
ncbi:MAG: T9SS type A sorting domain-containing protein [Flavobacteriaceae bacterium]|nr:T9SS type A sorting domain-containing protein [Flavobacteriaceae bacterium]